MGEDFGFCLVEYKDESLRGALKVCRTESLYANDNRA